MGISLYNLMQQVRLKTDKGEEQEIIKSLINSLASVVEKSYYLNKKDENASLDGSFMQTYINIPIKFDGQYYYTTFPSTYALLPHSFGIKTVDFTDGKNPFWKVDNFEMYNNLPSAVMGGNFVYEPIGMNCYFKNMGANDVKDRTIKFVLACGFDGIDSDTTINISPNLAEQVVQMVIQLFSPTPPAINETLK
mgnify:CR=1 FL=1